MGIKRFIHLSREHSPALDCFWCLLAVPIDTAVRWGVAPEGMVAATAEKPNWCKYHFPWDWKETSWHILADTTNIVGKWQSDFARYKQHCHTITTNHCRTLSQRGKSGQYYTMVEKILLMSTCRLFPDGLFLVILWHGNEYVALRSFLL